MTIEEIIRRGQLVVNGPVTLILIFGYFLPLVLDNNDLLVFSLLTSFVLAWLWWSFSIVKWRVWAYRQVKSEQVGELKRAAIKALLTWPDNCILSKTEIKTANEERAEGEKEMSGGKSTTVKSSLKIYVHYLWIFIGIAIIIFLSNLFSR